MSPLVLNEVLQRGIIELILASKAKDQNAGTSQLKQKIDRIVYGFYGLTDEKIAIVEGKQSI